MQQEISVCLSPESPFRHDLLSPPAFLEDSSLFSLSRFTQLFILDDLTPTPRVSFLASTFMSSFFSHLYHEVLCPSTVPDPLLPVLGYRAALCFWVGR